MAFSSFFFEDGLVGLRFVFWERFCHDLIIGKGQIKDGKKNVERLAFCVFLSSLLRRLGILLVAA